ncbi:24294_t:CDS:2, partial [Gigaspora margarita]
TEPTSLFVLKNFVLILLLIALFGYTWLIIWGIYNDNPIIQNSLAEETSFPAPFIQLTTAQKINISCHFVNASGTHDCNQYIFPYNDDAGKIGNGEIYSAFFVKEDLKFSTIPNNGISYLEFKIYLNDTRFNLSDSTIVPIVILGLVDVDFARNYKRNILLTDQLSTYSQLPTTIDNLNRYTLSAYYLMSDSELSTDSRQNESTQLDIGRKEMMLPSWENFIGFSSKLESLPYLTSKLETFPLSNDTSELSTLSLLTKIVIEAQSFIVQVETDKRF